MEPQRGWTIASSSWGFLRKRCLLILLAFIIGNSSLEPLFVDLLALDR